MIKPYKKAIKKFKTIKILRNDAYASYNDNEMKDAINKAQETAQTAIIIDRIGETVIVEKLNDDVGKML